MVYKKPVPQERKLFKVPQTVGVPGWIVLTYDNDIPVCVWMTAYECRKLPCIVDERLCGDTFLRVEKVGPMDYAIADIWMYNGNCVFACSTFEQRYNWLQKLLSKFTSCIEGITIDLIHKSDLDLTQLKLRGYECYVDEIGEKGIFIEDDGSQFVKVKKLALPDCYEVEGGGYLRVPTLTCSRNLRSLGDIFELKVRKFDEESWEVIV